jgi:SAM-dependent methyltransferase
VELIITYSSLLELHLVQLKKAAESGQILDLACGTGRNGLYLINNNIPVLFSDVKKDSLAVIKETLNSNTAELAHFWHVDFEQKDNQLKNRTFSGIMVFRYLHRPLFESIKNAILPGGIIIYETFTVENRQFGRPHNAHYLLNKGELVAQFKDWNIIHQFEGIIDNQGSPQAIAQIIALKPFTE